MRVNRKFPASAVSIVAFTLVACIVFAQQSNDIPLQVGEINSSVQGLERQILENAMVQLPVAERQNVILLTADGHMVANKPELLQGMVVTPHVGPPVTSEDSLPNPTIDPIPTTSQTAGTTGTNGTTAQTTGTTGSTGTNGTTTQTTGTTGSTGTNGTTTQTTGTTGSTGTNGTTGTTSTPYGCDCTVGIDATAQGRTYKGSGPYRRTITTNGQGIFGIKAKVFLPGRANPLESTTGTPTAAQILANKVSSDSFLNTLQEAGSPYIYMGGSLYNTAGTRKYELDLGLQASGQSDRYNLFGHGDFYTFRYEAEGGQADQGHFEMNQTVEIEAKPGRWQLALIVKGKKYEPGVAEGPETTITLIASDVMYVYPFTVRDLFWWPDSDRAEFKWATSIGQAWSPTPRGRKVGTDIPSQISWICGVEWSDIQVRRNTTWSLVTTSDISDIDNYPAQFMYPSGEPMIPPTIWLNLPIVVQRNSPSNEVVSIDLRRNRTAPTTTGGSGF